MWADFTDYVGQKVGIDQCILVKPGFVLQDKGEREFNLALHFGCNSVCWLLHKVYVALMTDQTADPALKANYFFENLTGKRDVQPSTAI